VWCSVVQCGASVVQYGAVWCSVVQCGASVVQCGAVREKGHVCETVEEFACVYV